ncbi:MAG: formate dehydrogenase accessory sulfurtransferase FdhD, partial [bacterium]
MQPVIVREIRRVSLAPAPGAEPIADRIAVEEPLEIRVNGKPLAVTLRTPGDDEALAAGFLHAEGFVSSPDDIAAIRRRAGNVIEVRLAGGRRRGPAIRPRRFPVTGACGVCGKSGIEQLRFAAPPIVSSLAVAATVLRDAAAGLRDAQPLFRLTGGLHGAGVFAADGTLRVLKEDVGRHNAVDKAVGALVL